MPTLRWKWLPIALLTFFVALSSASPQKKSSIKPITKPPTKIQSLFFAIKKGNLDKVKSLLKEGVNPNARDDEGTTPLCSAILTFNRQAKKQIVEALLQNKADPNLGTQTKHRGDMSFPSGMTALMLASLIVDYDSAELLLKSGAKVDAVNADGSTAIMYTSFYPSNDPKAKTSVDLASLYINNGADVNHKDKSGITPLMSAINGYSVEMVQFLLDKGADITIKNKRGQTPLLFAIHNISLLISATESYKAPALKIVKALIAKGAGQSEEEKKQALKKARFLDLKEVEALLNK